MRIPLFDGNATLKNIDFRMIKESFHAILFSIIADVFAGIFLVMHLDTFLSIPGLLLIIPGTIAMRGNIFSSFTARLGSALHLGKLFGEDSDNRYIYENVVCIFFQTLLFSMILAFFVYVISLLISLSIDILSILTILFLASVLSAVILLVVAIFISIGSYKKGWDPDNISVPVITAAGDLITIPSIILITIIFFELPSFLNSIVPIIFIIITVLLLIFILKKNLLTAKNIIMQSTGILIFTALLECFAGTVLQMNSGLFILVLIPAFLAEAGNIGGILASRLSSKCHLGLITSWKDENVKKDFISSYLLCFITYTILFMIFVILTWNVNFLLYFVLLISGFLVISVLNFLALFLTLSVYKIELDPDNIVIPVLTAVADTLGIIVLTIMILVL